MKAKLRVGVVLLAGSVAASAGGAAVADGADSGTAARAAGSAKVVVNDAGDTGSNSDDLTGLTVKLGAKNLVIRGNFADVDYGDAFRFWIDVPGKQRNYFGLAVPEGDYAPLRLVRRQGTTGLFGPCDGFSARYLSGSDQPVRISIARRCINNAARARVATLTTFADSGVRDSVPNGRAWTSQVVAAS